MRMYRVVDCSDQQGAMIVYVVSLYDTYLGGLLVRLTLPLLFSSLVTFVVSRFSGGLLVRLTLPLLFSSLGTTVVSRFFGTQDGNYRGTATIYCIYSRLTCVHVEPAQPMPSAAPPLLWETHPRYTSGGTRRKGARLLVGNCCWFRCTFCLEFKRA